MNTNYKHVNKYAKKIINKLLDKYESSKTFTGDNKVNQTFSYEVGKLFPDYQDLSKYEVFENINETIGGLVNQNLIITKLTKNSVYKRISLNVEELEKAYKLVRRKPKKDIQGEISVILEIYDLSDGSPLSLYAENQLENIRENKTVKYFNGDIDEYRDLLKAVNLSYKNEEEIFIRDFSIKCFGDSKRYEDLSAKVKSLLFEYGNFPEKEMILEELNIIKTPSYVAVKGAGEISFGHQSLNLNLIRGDISISSVTLGDISKVKVTASRVITVENLTSFHSMGDSKKEAFIIYLGGFHNTIRREFIKNIYRDNPACEYYHFGDIDAGGFYIYEHLRRKTGVPFKPYKMDIATLKEHKTLWKPLTANDKKRIRALIEMVESEAYRDVLEFMLEKGCKMEQEGIRA